MSLIKNYHIIKKARVTHGFFTRLNGFSKKDFRSLNCSISNGDNKKLVLKNRQKALKNLGLQNKKLILINQIHSSKVVLINSSNINKKIEADGMMTSLNNIVLGVLTADCAPIFIYDNKNRFVCCLHSGWKGTLKNISKKAVNMFRKHKINLKNITAIVGPCLNKKNYEVDRSFEKKFIKKNQNYSKFFTKKNINKSFFNLRGLINYQLKELGIKKIHNINLDTYAHERLFFSHRRSKHQNEKTTGRLINLISLT